jgi:hypothetical protein
MSIFEPSTTTAESPDLGQEEVVTEEQNTEYQETEIEETGAEETTEEVTEEDSPSEKTEQGEEPEFDYSKAYRELRKDYTRKAQELAELKRQQLQMAPQYMPGQEQDFEQLNERFWQEFQQNPTEMLYRFADSVANQRLQQMEQQMQQLIAPIYEDKASREYRRNMEGLTKTHPQIKTEEGYQQFVQRVQEIAQELGNPNLVYNPPKRILDLAAKELFGDTGTKLYQRAVAKGKEEALNNIRTKQGLGTSNGAKPKTQPKSIEEQIAESIVNSGRSGGIFG